MIIIILFDYHICTHIVIDEILTEDETKHQQQLQSEEATAFLSNKTTNSTITTHDNTTAMTTEGNSDVNTFLRQDNTRMKSENSELRVKLETIEREYQDYRRKQGIHVYMYIYTHTFDTHAYIHICIHIYIHTYYFNVTCVYF